MSTWIQREGILVDVRPRNNRHGASNWLTFALVTEDGARHRGIAFSHPAREGLATAGNGARVTVRGPLEARSIPREDGDDGCFTDMVQTAIVVTRC